MEPGHEEDLTGRTVDHYAIVALIAGGGQGRVYRGRDERLHRDVAIKVLPPSRLANPSARRGLIAEARALSLLNHPHVAGIYDFVTHGGRDFIVMEFTSSGELKILDFGVAKMMPAGVVVESVTKTPSRSTVGGTIPYMAPEQLRGEATDERTDIFSVGTVLYEMATGCAAFPQRNLACLIDAIQHQEPSTPTTVNPHVPLALERVITKAMRKDLDTRQQSAMELAEDLEALLPVGRSGSGPLTGSAWPYLAAGLGAAS